MMLHNEIFILGTFINLVLSITIGVILYYSVDLEFIYIAIISAGIFIFLTFFVIGIGLYYKNKNKQIKYIGIRQDGEDEEGRSSLSSSYSNSMISYNYEFNNSEYVEYLENKYRDFLMRENNIDEEDLTAIYLSYNTIMKSHEELPKNIKSALKEYSKNLNLDSDDVDKLNNSLDNIEKIKYKYNWQHYTDLLTKNIEEMNKDAKKILINEFDNEYTKINEIILNKLTREDLNSDEFKRVLTNELKIEGGHVGYIRGSEDPSNTKILASRNQSPDIISKIGYYLKLKK